MFLWENDLHIGITGHRPNKLNNEYDGTGDLSQWIKHQIIYHLDQINALHDSNTVLISGMALGVDMLFAEISIEYDLSLVAAIPCLNQEKKWPKKSQDRYHRILEYDNCEQVLVSETEYRPWVMHKRNQWIVNHVDHLIAVWDGSPGGTSHCVKSAKSEDKSITRIDPNDFTN